MALSSPRSLEHVSPHDGIVVLPGATWADFQRVLELRGDRSAPRIAYLDGSLEITSPSRHHESIKHALGRLVEVWCLERGIEFSCFGSWTLEDKEARRGLEPDECFVFGENDDPTRPDLAIEVIWTSGGIDKLDIYRRLEVPEVWIWKGGHLTAYVLREQGYDRTDTSALLPGIDLSDLAAHVDRPTTSRAIREYRAHLQAAT